MTKSLDCLKSLKFNSCYMDFGCTLPRVLRLLQLKSTYRDQYLRAIGDKGS